MTAAASAPPAAVRVSGVSCTSASFCVAVGNQGDDLTATWAAEWDGETWRAIDPPVLPKTDEGVGLQAVSCISPSDCQAVGSYDTDGNTEVRSLAYHWDGAAWSPEPVPMTKGSSADLLGVSCAPSGFCQAVGISAGDGQPCAERLDDGAWVADGAVRPMGQDAYLTSVSCTSSTACTATGHTFFPGPVAALAEVWDGTHWSISHLHLSNASLSSVSCGSSALRLATGSDSSTKTPLAVDVPGRQPSSVAPVQVAAAFDAVSCSGPDTCTAVGSFNENGGLMAQRYDGGQSDRRPQT